MNRSLGSLVIIKSGYTLRSSVDNYNQGPVSVLQAINVIANNYTNLPSISIDNPEKHTLQSNDVLLSTKGNFRAALFANIPQQTIASSSLSILRLTTNEILPTYLVLYLNSTYGQRALSKIATGSHIRSIKKLELSDIIIPIPTPNIQQYLVEYDKTITKQQSLLDKKINLLESLMNQTINRTLEETT